MVFNMGINPSPLGDVGFNRTIEGDIALRIGRCAQRAENGES